MTIHSLIRKCYYKPVFNNIYKFYLNDENQYSLDRVARMDINFLSAWNNLLNTKATKSKDEDVENSCIFISDLVENGSKLFDICLLNKTNNETYGIDFLDWSELINKKIKTDFSDSELTGSEILAHILWEITFWGFSSDQVQLAGSKIIDETNEVVEEIDFEKFINLTKKLS